MNLKSVKNGIVAAVIGATTLGGTLVKVPAYKVRQAQKEVAEAAQVLKKRQAEFTKDSVAFTTKHIKTAADSAVYNKSLNNLDDAESDLLVNELLLAVTELTKKNDSVSLIRATGENILYPIGDGIKNMAQFVSEGWGKASDKATKLYNNFTK